VLPAQRGGRVLDSGNVYGVEPIACVSVFVMRRRLVGGVLGARGVGLSVERNTA
jgi:hypothetical protein